MTDDSLELGCGFLAVPRVKVGLPAEVRGIHHAHQAQL
jgi:hypothetical protein